MNEPVDLDLASPIATLWLNRPDQYNAVNPELMQALIAAAAQVSDADDVRAVIVRGAGRHFSVGADLKAPPPTTPPGLLQRRRNIEAGQRLMRALREIRQPTICAVQGVAAGAGACIATACDFRVASADARAGYPEVRRGMNLMWHAVPVCTALIGPARAKQMIMSGRLVDAATLLDWGFFDEVVAPDQLARRAQEWAQDYADLPPVPVQMIKRSIDAASGALNDALMHMDADQFLLTAATEDAKEGAQAFLEKRPPRFTGN